MDKEVIDFDKQIFLERLKESIKRSNLSYAKAARKAGITQHTMNKYLYKGVVPKIENFIKLQHAIGFNADYLLQITDDPEDRPQTP